MMSWRGGGFCIFGSLWGEFTGDLIKDLKCRVSEVMFIDLENQHAHVTSLCLGETWKGIYRLSNGKQFDFH